MSKLKITSATVKKLLISFLIGIVLFFSAAPTAMAAAPWYSQDFGSWYAKVYDTTNSNEIFGERYTAAQVQWVFYGVISFFINLASGNNAAVSGCISSAATGNATSCAEPLINSQNEINSQFKIGDAGKSIFAMIFEDRTVSGITYVKNLGRKFHLVPEVKAQTGFGYSGALGVIPDIQAAWALVRNISYAIFVIILIAFAFMIMFRVKISPQTVVTVQSALPKVVIGIILVTFSYAIAGFLIDIMYVVIGIISLIFSGFTVAGVRFDVINGALGSPTSSAPGVTGYFTLLTQGPTFLGLKTGIFGLMVMYFVNYFLAFIYIVFGGFIAGLFGAGGVIGGSVVALVTLVIGFIGLIVVFIVALLNFFKIIILLTKAFLFIILLTIFAPLQLTLGTAISSLGFGAWVKSYAAKLAIFPAVGVMFVISLWFLQLGGSVIRNAPTIFGGGPTNFAEGWPPLLGGSPQLVALAFLLASIGVFCMIPKVGDMIEGFIAGKGVNLGTAIGEAVALPQGVAVAGLESAAKKAEEAGTPVSGIPYRILQGIIRGGK